MLLIHVHCREDEEDEENGIKTAADSGKSQLCSKPPNVVQHHLRTFVPEKFKGD
jgi:hypothetical protein